MRNVEIKARVTEYDKVCQIAEELSCGTPIVILQDDTFYKVNEGRLKMRFNDDSTASLIRYERPDETGPKLSDYDILEFSASELDKAKLLDKMLKESIGVRGRVVKERKLYMISQTRIHVDSVKGLGNFLELEVVLRPEQTTADGQAIAWKILPKLLVKREDLIHCAYIDLLDKKK